MSEKTILVADDESHILNVVSLKLRNAGFRVLTAGDGAELRKPLGIAIVGGLLVSQVLTLYTTPVVYLYLDRLRLWQAGRQARRLERRLQKRLQRPLHHGLHTGVDSRTVNDDGQSGPPRAPQG